MACRNSVFVLLLVVDVVATAPTRDDGIRVVVNASAGRIAGKYNGMQWELFEAPLQATYGCGQVEWETRLTRR